MANDTKRFVVGIVPGMPTNLRSFDTEDEAAAFIETLDDHEDGRYYLDDMAEAEGYDETHSYTRNAGTCVGGEEE